LKYHQSDIFASYCGCDYLGFLHLCHSYWCKMHMTFQKDLTDLKCLYHSMTYEWQNCTHC